MLPAYRCNRFSSLFFVVFIVVGCYFLLSLTLAVSYSAYKHQTKVKIIHKYEVMMSGFDAAFWRLVLPASTPVPTSARTGGSLTDADLRASTGAGGGRPSVDLEDRRGPGLRRSDWLAFYRVLRPDLDQELVGHLFDVMDGDGRGLIFRQEFRRLMLHFSRLQAEPKTPQRQVNVVNPVHAAGKVQAGPQAQPLVVVDGATDGTGGSGQAALPNGDAKAAPDGGAVATPAHTPDWSPDSRRKTSRCTGRCPPSRLQLQQVVGSAWATYFFDAVVLANGVCVVLELLLETDVSADRPADTLHRVYAVQTATLVVFVVEVVSKLLVFSPKTYWMESNFNRLDVIVMVASLVGVALVESGAIDSDVSSTVTFFRMIRIMRLFHVLPNFDITVRSFVDIIPVLAQYVAVLLSVFYFFAIIGMESFAGKLVPGPTTIVVGNATQPYVGLLGCRGAGVLECWGAGVLGCLKPPSPHFSAQVL